MKKENLHQNSSAQSLMDKLFYLNRWVQDWSLTPFLHQDPSYSFVEAQAFYHSVTSSIYFSRDPKSWTPITCQECLWRWIRWLELTSSNNAPSIFTVPLKTQLICQQWQSISSMSFASQPKWSFHAWWESRKERILSGTIIRTSPSKKITSPQTSRNIWKKVTFLRFTFVVLLKWMQMLVKWWSRIKFHLHFIILCDNIIHFLLH